MRASVVIPTRDRPVLLAECLTRLLRQTVLASDYEIIVVDDASPTDDTARVVDTLATTGTGPAITLLRQHERSGAAVSRNAAIDAARGDVLIFVDDDAFVGSHFVERHLAVHAHGTPALAAGPIVQVRVIPASIDESRSLAGYHRHPLPGGNGSAPTDAVRRVGGYDPQFRVYGWHDQELAERLLSIGLRRRFVWGAPIHHFKPPEYDLDLRMQIARERERGRMGARFYQKHPTWSVGVTTKVAPAVRALVGALARVSGTDRLCRQLELGELSGRDVRPWRAALVRAWVESTEGGLELARLSARARES